MTGIHGLASRLVGWWVASDDKALLIERGPKNALFLSVHPSRAAPPYRSAVLLDGTRKAIHRCAVSLTPPVVLTVEAGTDGLGPTYSVHPGLWDGEAWVPTLDLANRGIALIPSVTIGLYDEWEDDLGVPWAFPLVAFHRHR